MKIILLTLTIMLAHAGSKEEAKDIGATQTAAGSLDIDKCFECNKDVTDGLQAAKKKEAVERTTDVYGKAQTPTSDGDSSAVKEGK